MMPRSPKHLLISTGDASGVQHVIPLVRELRRQFPDLRLSVVGDARLAEEPGVNCIARHEAYGLGAWGVMETLKSLRSHLKLGNDLEAFVRREQVDRVLFVDYGGFHLRLAKRLSPLTELRYYIAPQLWASRRYRIKSMVGHFSRIYTIFPFEEAVYQPYNIPCTFVGHPLQEHLPPPVSAEEFCQTHGLDVAQPIIGLFPGSRKMEIERLLPVFASALKRAKTASPRMFQVVMALAPNLEPNYVRGRVNQAFQEKGMPAPLCVTHQNHALLSAADFILGASGTTSLEAALYGTPMIIAYKVDALTAAIARRVIDVNYIGLPNLLVPEDMSPILPERIQEDCTPEALAADICHFLDAHHPARQKADAGLTRVATALQSGIGTSGLATHLITQ
jgi:lipid-A-disaccharide synthase